MDAWKDIDPREEVLSGFDSFSERVTSYFLSPSDYFIFDLVWTRICIVYSLLYKSLVWIILGYIEGGIFNFTTVFVVNAYQNIMAILQNSVFNSIQIFYWIKCINLITQYSMGLHIRHSLCKCSPSITKDIKYINKNK